MSNEIVCGSFDDHKSYFMSSQYDKKSLLRVKIIKNDKHLPKESESDESDYEYLYDDELQILSFNPQKGPW